MSQNDDFFGGMKSDKDKTKEWTDAAQYYVDIRRTGEPEAIEPLPEEPAKTAAPTLRGIGQGALNLIKRVDPTGTAKAMSGSRAGAVAGLAGAGLAGLTTAITSRGKKELGGQSRLEHALVESKKLRESQPEPKGFSGKMRNMFSDMSANVASAARKHPAQASLVGALGGAAAGTKLLGYLTRKV